MSETAFSVEDHLSACSVLKTFANLIADLAVVEEVWKPLLRPAFLEGLWLKLTGLWRRAGFYPAAAGGDPNQALASYTRTGSIPCTLQGDSLQVSSAHACGVVRIMEVFSSVITAFLFFVVRGTQTQSKQLHGQQIV